MVDPVLTFKSDGSGMITIGAASLAFSAGISPSDLVAMLTAFAQQQAAVEPVGPLPIAIAGLNTSNLTLAIAILLGFTAIELRVISDLLQRELGSTANLDELRVLRNDKAFDLGIPGPIPGN